MYILTMFANTDMLLILEPIGTARKLSYKNVVCVDPHKFAFLVCMIELGGSSVIVHQHGNVIHEISLGENDK